MGSAPVWSTACPDWEKRIVDRRSLIPFDPLFPESARSGLGVFNALTVVDVLGSPPMVDLARPWLTEFVGSVFGAYDPESGRRLVREWLLLISKKNTKSTSAGLLMLTFLILNWRQAGEFGILAPTVEVANNAFKPARDAIKADEDLSALLHVQDHIRTITHRETGATLQVVAADSETVAGKKWIVTLVDELWLFGKKANAEDMLREATGGLASRPEGCVIWLSTQSNDPPAGVFKQKLQYARGVRDGRIVDPEFCPVLYEFPDSMLNDGSYKDPDNFYVTNPNIGASVDEAFLVREFGKAQNDGEESLRGFLAKHLNVEIGLNLRSDRWTGADFWQSAGDASLTLAAIIERSDVLMLGLDGGGLDDMLGAAVLGREMDTGRWLHWGCAWIHPIALERRKSEAARWKDFAADGHLVIVAAVGDDIAQVVDLAMRLEDSGKLAQVAVDPIGISDIVAALNDAGIEEDVDGKDRIIGIPQGYKLTGSIKTVERRLAEGTLRHAGAPLMAYCVGNAKVEARGNAVLITKQASGFAKIDPLCALFNAATLMSIAPEPEICSDMEVMSV